MYIVYAQFAGAFIGACLVFILFKGQFDMTEDKDIKRGVFCTSPSVPNFALNLASEVIGTFVLVFAIKGIAQVTDIAPGLSYILVFGIIVSIGMSLGGLTGYAINPARDLGPRLAHFLMPIKDKGPYNWRYAVIPLFGPIVAPGEMEEVKLSRAKLAEYPDLSTITFKIEKE